MKVVATLVIVLAAALVACDEDFEAHYSTYDDLVAAGPGPVSWFPEWTPHTATDLREAHNIGTNYTVLAFSFPPGGSSFLRSCKPTLFPENPSQASWRPNDKDFAHLQHFQCDERVQFGDGHFETRTAGAVIDAQHSRVYFWRPRGA